MGKFGTGRKQSFYIQRAGKDEYFGKFKKKDGTIYECKLDKEYADTPKQKDSARLYVMDTYDIAVKEVVEFFKKESEEIQKMRRSFFYTKAITLDENKPNTEYIKITEIYYKVTIYGSEKYSSGTWRAFSEEREIRGMLFDGNDIDGMRKYCRYLFETGLNGISVVEFTAYSRLIGILRSDYARLCEEDAKEAIAEGDIIDSLEEN